MMLSIQIANRMVELHAAGRPSDIPELVKLRTFAYLPADLPASTIYPVKLDPSLVGGRLGAINEWMGGMMLEHRVKGNGSTPIDEVVGPLLEWANLKLAGQIEAGLFKRIVEGPIGYEYDQADYTYCKVQQMFLVEFQTKVGDLSLWA